MNIRFKDDLVFQIPVMIAFILISMVTVYPFVYALAYSFSNGTTALIHNIYLWPVDFTLDNYKAMFSNDKILRGFFISCARTAIGTVAFLFVTGLCAYALSQKKLVGGRFFMLLFIIPMYVSGVMLPYYVVVRGLGLYNNFLVYILPQCFNAFYMMLMKVYFENLPDSLEEAAEIDGATEMQILVKVIIPLSKPVFATVALFVSVSQWNAWFDAMVFVTKDSIFPLQFILQNILREQQVTSFQQVSNMIGGSKSTSTETLRMAVLIITTAPIIFVYPFAQKYFVKGLTLGAVKQ